MIHGNVDRQQTTLAKLMLLAHYLGAETRWRAKKGHAEWLCTRENCVVRCEADPSRK